VKLKRTERQKKIHNGNITVNKGKKQNNYTTKPASIINEIIEHIIGSNLESKIEKKSIRIIHYYRLFKLSLLHNRKV